MIQGWKQAYWSLTDYIKSNPSINIEPAVTAIPPDVRPGFYAVFDQVREAFIVDNFKDELDAAKNLSREYKQLAGDIVSIMDIQPEIELNPRLKWLMDDPLNGLMRLIYSPLFDLLKGKLDEEEFVQTCHVEFGSVFDDLYRKGFNLWVILALLELFEPSELMWVPQKEPNAINSLKELYKQGARVEPIPDITHTSLLSFEPGTWDTFIVPDIVFYSAKLNKYVAMRRSLPVNTNEPYLVAKQRTSEREWLSFRQLSRIFNLANHWPDILIYCAEKPQTLNLIADFDYLLRPDMAIDTFNQYSSFNAGEAGRIRSHQQHLKPFKGTTVLYQNNIPDEAVKAFSPDEPGNSPLPVTSSTSSSVSTPIECFGQETGTVPEIAASIQAAEDEASAMLSTINLMTSRGFNRQSLSQIVDGLI